MNHLDEPKQLGLIEVAKCAEDKQYFIEKYCKIISIFTGKPIDIKLNKMQLDYLHDETQVIKSARQVGKDLIILMDMIWDVIFSDNTNILYANYKTIATQDMLNRFLEYYSLCEFPLKPKITYSTKEKIEFDNGVTIIFKFPNENVMHSKTFSKVIFSEYEWNVNIGKTRKELRNLLNIILPNTKILKFVSSHSKENVSARVIQELVAMKIPFDYYEHDYSVVPERDIEWEKKCIENTSEEAFSIEHKNGL